MPIANSIDELLAQAFPQFEEALVQDINQHGKIISTQNSELVVQVDAKIAYTYLVCTGTLEIYRTDPHGREILLYYAAAGEMCSSELICCSATRTNHDMYARSIEKSTLIMLPQHKTTEWIDTHNTWKQCMFAQYRVRFNELIHTIDSIAFHKMDERLILFFKNYYTNTKKTLYTGTHADIALSLNSSREVISRLLKTLEHNKLISLARNKIDFSKLL